jgi:hypothetical protein
MSQLNLLGDSFFKIPLAPNLAQTLLLIETNRYFPTSSMVSLDQHIPYPSLEDDELSIDLDLQPSPTCTLTSASTIKKKKTGCTCKKTKCLKMYCECFSSGKLCTDDCACYGCGNDHDHTESLSKAR